MTSKNNDELFNELLQRTLWKTYFLNKESLRDPQLEHSMFIYDKVFIYYPMLQRDKQLALFEYYSKLLPFFLYTSTPPSDASLARVIRFICEADPLSVPFSPSYTVL